jgi:biofilm PGA synthesis N-glycosyltransferase PgaC
MKDKELPHVHIVIAAHNEARIIARRIQNLQMLDYPTHKMDVYLGTDGCTDATAEIAREAASNDDYIKIMEFSENRGKMVVLREIISHIGNTGNAPSSSLLVFSDANTMFAHDAVRNLVKSFSDPRVGGVCGRLVFTHPSPESADIEQALENPAEEGLYWRLETKLKAWESALDSCLGANGAIYAIRPTLFWESIPTNTIVDDFVIGMKVREQGYRMIYDPSAIATEELPVVGDEWARRVRIGAGDYQALGFCKACLSPRFGVFAWAFWSHKVLRWVTPHLVIAMACISFVQCLFAYDSDRGFLDTIPAISVAALLTFLLAAGQTGKIIRKSGYTGFGARFCAACDHFITMHAALFVGWLRFCKGGMSGTWKRTPR